MREGLVYEHAEYVITTSAEFCNLVGVVCKLLSKGVPCSIGAVTQVGKKGPKIGCDDRSAIAPCRYHSY